MKTKTRLLRAATAVFGERGFNKASVSAICRRAGVAQGTFYRYFQNKEDIYLGLVGQLERRLRRALRTAASGGSREALLRIFENLLAGIRRNRELYQIFREAEFVRMEVPQRFYHDLAQIFKATIAMGQDAGVFREIEPEVAAFAVLGIAEFLAMRYLLWEAGELDPKALHAARTLILSGIDPDGRSPLIADISLSEQEPDAAASKGERTRAALLRAAERLFGEGGFHNTTISAITYVAGVAQGTFYIYFPSKVEIFTALVREINRKLRRAIRAAITGLHDRRDVECVGFQAFFEFISRHRDAYRIVREAEFVDEGVGRWYYHRLAEGYVRGLRQGMERGEIRKLEPEPLAYALLGIGHFIGLRWIVWEHKERLPGEILRDTLDFILHGIGAEEA